MPKNDAPGAEEREDRESGRIAGELAAQRLFELIAERMEHLSEVEGLTQAKLAHRIGVSEQQLSFWLNKTRNMTVRSAGRLLHGLRAHLLFEADNYEAVSSFGNSRADCILDKATTPQLSSSYMEIIDHDLKEKSFSIIVENKNTSKVNPRTNQVMRAQQASHITRSDLDCFLPVVTEQLQKASCAQGQA